MEARKSLRSTAAGRRRADLRLLRTALVSAVLLSLIPTQIIVTTATVGLLTASVVAITWLMRD